MAPRVSSNAFAHGSNQNSGNFLTDTRTTRVHAPPGGRSSLSLAWDDAPCRSKTPCRYQEEREQQRQLPNDRAHGEGKNHARNSCSDPCTDQHADDRFGRSLRATSNSFANGSNQNCGNVLTDVPSTRVHAPPGGRSSVSLSWTDSRSGSASVPMPPSCYSSRADMGSLAGYRQARAASNAGYEEDESDALSKDQASRVDRIFGQRARTTSNSFASSSSQNCGNVVTDVPSTRVHAPPGGRSSISLGWADSRKGSASVPMPPPGCHSTADLDRNSNNRSDLCGNRQARATNHVGYEEHAFGQRARTSSNSFARGSNQNNGNVITDVPSTRVHAPPGGYSSVSFSWDGSQRSSTCLGQKGQQTPRALTRNIGSESVADSECELRASHWSDVRADNYVVKDSDGYARHGGYGGHPTENDAASEQESRAIDCSLSQRPRTTSNSYACGANQNSGNVITDVPSTRVHAPPGGRSSFSLGWKDSKNDRIGTRESDSYTPRTRHDVGSKNRSACDPEFSAAYYSGVGVDDQCDIGVGRHVHSAGCDAGRGEPQGSFSDTTVKQPHAMLDDTSFQHFKQASGPSACDKLATRTVAKLEHEVDHSKLRMLKQGLRGHKKPEVEGARPRVYKPSVCVHGPPGGTATFSPDWDPKTEERSQGKKLFPGSDGAGNNRDMHAIEALRYFQAQGKRVGKQTHDEAAKNFAEKRALESHRFHIPAGEGGVRLPGKAHRGVERRASSTSTCDETPRDYEDRDLSECDSLPLGAEWCSYN